MKTNLPAEGKRRAFTLIELLVVTGIILVLAAIALPVFSRLQVRGRMTNELSAARQVMAAFSAYTAEHDGELLPGYADYPARDERGKALKNPVNHRYPWRLAPYLDYDLRVLYGLTGDKRLKTDRERDYDGYVYAVSVAPALGMNTVFVGGDYKTLNPDSPRAQAAYGNFCVRRMVEAAQPSKLLVFASACFESEGRRVPGYFKVEAPNFVTGRKWADEYSADAPPSAYGNVDFRFDGKAIAAMLDGHIQLLGFDDMNDQRRWSNTAAAENKAMWHHFGPDGWGSPGGTGGSGGSGGGTSGGDTIDGKPINEKPNPKL